MGWKGALRSINAAMREAEREAKRRQRELERQQKEFEKMQELERAEYEVELYENRIELLSSIHQDCGSIWDWEKIKSTAPPTKPVKAHISEENAKKKLEEYNPSFFDKLFHKVEPKQANLIKNVQAAQKGDEKEFKQSFQAFEKEYSDWQENSGFANQILNGEAQTYEEAIKQINPFSEINEIGSSIKFEVINSSIIDVKLNANSEQVIPSEVKSLLKSGKLTTKQMPKGQFYELYQDYLCGCILRVARELFALLPIKASLVTAVGNLLNTQTGHIEEQPIISIFIPRATLDKLNFDMIDASDSMSNFVHNMNFKKTSGFAAVKKLDISTLELLN